MLSTAKFEGLTEGIELGKAEGIAKGIEEGQARERMKLAGQALKMGMAIEDITKLTGLSREEIEKL